HGPSKGKKLSQLSVSRHVNPKTLLEEGTDVLVLIENLPEERLKLSRSMAHFNRHPEKYESMIIASIPKEDTRLPRFDLGIGVWVDERSMFITLSLIYGANNAFCTEFEGRP